MNSDHWSQAVILFLCAVNTFLLLALFAKRHAFPQPTSNPSSPDSGWVDAKQDSKPEDKSVILLTPERDARILDGEDE